MTNQFLGLHTGPVDHQSTSVINAIANNKIQMGATVLIDQNLSPTDILPRVRGTTSSLTGTPLVYGIAVGGDADGIYNDGAISTDDTTQATLEQLQAIKVVTQGRCPALIKGFTGAVTPAQINIGDPLTHNQGRLQLAASGDTVIARALHPVSPSAVDVIAVDVKREGPL